MAIFDLDHRIFLWINSFAKRNPVLDEFGVYLAVEGIYALIIVTAVLMKFEKYRKHALLALFSAFLSRFLVVELIKNMVDRPRPFEVLSVNQLIVDFGSGLSFSSGHAVIMFSIAFGFYRTKFFWPFLIFATLSSIARIFVGVHYPLDILASIPIALVMVWLINKSMKAIR